ncbi:MAG: hypothetical protein IPP19_07340 [Verrucomicrobia bacterium]|nr:hypothetical protein [Verrucomicrobiota bacterium]
MISEETEPSRLLSVCATMGAHFRANKHSIPSDAVRKFLLETISKLKDGERAAAIYSTGWVTSIWKKLFEQPRTDWGPSANLAVIHCSISATDVDLEARKSAFNELCMLVTGEHSFTANERKAIDALLPALFDLLSNNGLAPDIRDSKLVTLLLSQPPASPHNKAFAGIIPYLLPGHTPCFSMGHPDALAVIELALKHHDKFVRDSAVAQIRARAPNDPVYKRLLPP